MRQYLYSVQAHQNALCVCEFENGSVLAQYRQSDCKAYTPASVLAPSAKLALQETTLLTRSLTILNAPCLLEFHLHALAHILGTVTQA
jgi:hypothetical protein